MTDNAKLGERIARIETSQHYIVTKLNDVSGKLDSFLGDLQSVKQKQSNFIYYILGAGGTVSVFWAILLAYIEYKRG